MKHPLGDYINATNETGDWCITRMKVLCHGQGDGGCFIGQSFKSSMIDISTSLNLVNGDLL